jgi:hypothetical protein
LYSCFTLSKNAQLLAKRIVLQGVARFTEGAFRTYIFRPNY